MSATFALIVAAGRGNRFGGDLPKQYTALAGRTVLYHTVSRFLSHPRVDGVRVVIHPDDRALYQIATVGLSLLAPVSGGASRQESVRLGLESLAEQGCGRVLIHDGARPFPPVAMIDALLDALNDGPGAIPALPVTDTLKQSPDGHFVGETVDRSRLWRAQTPQTFRFAPILAAHRACAGRALTDDAAVLEAVQTEPGTAIRLVAGAEVNLKITTRDDLRRAENMLAAALDSAPQAATEFRVGTGLDAHRLIPAQEAGGGARTDAFLTLCGVPIAHDHVLKGHSDADVALHAVTDALLGAIGAGDIGQHFPPSDPRWRGEPSATFVQHAANLLRVAGGRLVNLDLTLVCERPKIAPHRDAMRERLAEILGVPPDRLSIKATTMEKLGFTGRGEGIVAQAAVSVRLPMRSVSSVPSVPTVASEVRS